MKTMLKPFAILMANAAGNTSRADTRRTPMIGIMTEIARPVTILNDNERTFVLIPDVLAVASSNVSR